MRARRSPGRTASRRSAAFSSTASSIDAGRLPVYAVILAGGSGTRLWPLARAGRPKPFLPLFGGKSLFRRTYERIVPLVGRGRVVVVAGAGHLPWIRRETPEIPRLNLVEEEVGRNTAASIAIAALWIRARHPDGMMIVLPADHWIDPAPSFRATLRRGLEAVRRTGALLTIGLPARSPDTAFGYIRPAAKRIAPGIAPVAAFKEKPSAARAKRMVAAGGRLWNCGIFVWRASTILRALERFSPGAVRPLRSWARRRGPGPWRVNASVLRRTTALPIDRAVLERSRGVLVARASFRWSDLGNWGAVLDHLARDRSGNAALGRLLAVRASGCLGVNPSGLCVFVGVKGLVAARAGEVVLVCDRRAAQDVRQVTELLRGRLRRYR